MKPVPPAPVASADRSLFRAAVGAVRPLAAGTPPLARTRPLPRRRHGGVDDTVHSAWSDLPFTPALPDVAEQLGYRRPGCDTKLLRQLRRGHYPVRGTLDLHQLTAAAAHTSLVAFLACTRQHGWRCVRIVHGRGLRSGARGPVLKRLTDRFLRECADVLAFVSAPPALGGTGAVLVLLRAAYAVSSRTTTVA